MALRDSSEASGKSTSEGSLAVAGLPTFWDVAEGPPNSEWEEWWDLFVMGVNAKFSISAMELPRTPTENQSHR